MRRVVTSAVFAKSERLSSFLICICEMTLTGRASEINEQKIGTVVFGRKPDYDSSIDGIVRPQASRLRQRLDLYFDGEGINEPERIRIPRGTYIPLFETRQADISVSDATKETAHPSTREAEANIEAEVPRGKQAFAKGVPLAWTLVGSLTLLLLIGTFKKMPSRPVSSPTSLSTSPLWRSIFRPDQKTLVVPSDTGLVMWQSATKKTINLSEYVTGSYRAQPSTALDRGQVDASDLASRRYTSIVDLAIVQELTHTADSVRGGIDLRYARDVRPGDFKQGNIILIGAAAANPWVLLFEPKMNFVFSDAQLRQYTVLNRSPAGSEPASWTSNYQDAQSRVFGVVALLPNLSNNGNVLIIEGTSMPGTQCAWDFIADDVTLKSFLNRIKRAGDVAPYFEVVLDCTNLTGSSVARTVLASRAVN